MRLIGLTAAVWTALAAVAASAQEKPVDVRTISTSGEAVVYAVPDEVVVNFGVETAQPELEKAKSLNDQAAAKLVKALKAMGIEAKYIQTDNMEIEIRYKDNGLVIDGYRVRRGYAVTLKDTKKFDSLTTTALQSGANRLLGFEYRTSELRQLRDQARRMAIKAGHEKAIELADAVSCQVGAPRVIQEGGGYTGYWGSRWGYGGNAMSQNVAQAAPGGAGDGGEATPLGQIAIRAQVSVTFDLVPFGK
jgi:uncharacterized protein